MSKSNSFNLQQRGEVVQAEEARKKDPYPKSIIFIIGNEFCERFSFYGMRTILVLYFKYILAYTENMATQAYHIFAMACYFTPLFGAILADSLLGKYWTILSISCVYAVGNILLSVSSISATSWLSLLGLALIAIGTGGIKPCVAAFGGDQFKPGQERQLQQFFSLFYISINSGSLISTYVTPIFRQDIHCFGRTDCYPLAFGVPAVLMVVALLLFIIGKFTTGYIIHAPQKDGIVGRVCSCVTRALRNKFTSNSPNKKSHWLDYADDKFDSKTISDVKALMRILFLYLPLPIFWALFDQQGSRWTLQAIRMNGQVGNIIIKPDQIQSFNPLLVVLFIPLFDYVIYPIMSKIGLNKPLRRMVLGGFLAALSFGVCGFIQTRIEAEAPVELISGHNHLAVVDLMNGKFNVDVTENVDRTKLQALYPGADIAEGENLLVYNWKTSNESAMNMLFNTTNILRKPNVSGSRLISVLHLLNVPGDVTLQVMGSDDIFRGHLKYNIGKNVHLGMLEPFEVEATGKSIEISLTSSHISKRYSYPADMLKQGATYVQLIMADFSNEDRLTVNVQQVVEPNHLSILFQIIQYLLMTSAEIMFSVTGLEFSYSQAPKSMKSVLQAAWLMTVAIGNLLVAVIANLKIFQQQSYEFLFFATLMLVDMFVFALMAYFYVPLNANHDDESSHLDSSTISLDQIEPKHKSSTGPDHTRNGPHGH